MSDYSPEKPKRVIVEHRGIDRVADRAQKALQSERHTENWSIWLKVVNGGIIKCDSYGMAVNVRQSLYLTRKLSRDVHGITPFDHLTIRLTYNEPNLAVEAKRTGILEIIPNAPTPTYTEDDADTALNNKVYVIPTPDADVPYDPSLEDGRPPIDLDEIFPADKADKADKEKK